MGQACGLSPLPAEPPWVPLTGPTAPSNWLEVTVVLTQQGQAHRLAQLEPLTLEERRPLPGYPTIVVDPEICYQTCLGFGGSFSEAAAEVWAELSPEKQDLLVDAYFSHDRGLGYRLGRLHVNSCDFCVESWSCCEAEEMDLASFSVQRYRGAIFPMVHSCVKAAGCPLALLASPWSPPAWMKDTRTMCSGGRLRPECRTAWAQHFVRFAQAMAEEGLPLWAFTVQNEPEATTSWENCLYTAEEERDFVRDYLGPQLQKSGLGNLHLIVHDHNRDTMFQRARTLFSDPAASHFIWGLAFHWYGDPRFEDWPDQAGQACFDNVRLVHDLRPDAHLIMTEACQESIPKLGDWMAGERYASNIIKDFNNWTEAWIDWNMVLDTDGGPNHAGNHCTAPVLADLDSDELLFQPSYYFLGHFSRYILPGARRVACGCSRDSLEATAYVNLDGTLATIVLNQSDDDIVFYLERGGKNAAAVKTISPAHSIATYRMIASKR